MDVIVDNYGDFNCKVENKEDTEKQFFVQRYNLGLKKKEATITNSGRTAFVHSNLTKDDTMTLKSLILLPQTMVKYSQIDLPGTNIMRKSELSKNIFFNFKIPNGRGNLSKIKINGKKINLIDESYNSNPLSLQNAILNYDKLDTKASKKYLLLGDMLELGKHSKKLHQSIGKIINNTKINKIFVKGNEVLFTYNSVLKKKRGSVFNNNSQIIDLIKNDLNNNDYLMVKASNATGLNKIVSNIKGSN